MRFNQLATFTGLCLVAACTTPGAQLLNGLGDNHMPVSTRLVASQEYFDQGLAMVYAFNHAEAERSFREARRLDPACAMSSWGLALALGPNINAPMSSAAEAEARAAIDQAVLRSGNATPLEQALIEAMTLRFNSLGGADQAERNRSYAAAMSRLAGRYPDDADVCTLAVAAFMETTPWHYWNRDGSPVDGTAHAVGALEAVLDQHPGHAGAIHFYIHLVEASALAARAEPHADRLAELMPSAGHIVHMPSHIYMRVGRYGDAANTNVLAIMADENYLEQRKAQGIYPTGSYPHNIHTLWAAQSMQGRGVAALETAQRVARADAGTSCCSWSELSREDRDATPLYTMVRFGMWRDVLAAKRPARDQPFATAMWHYARGLAFCATSDREAAAAELERLREFAADGALCARTLNLDTAGDVLGIAERCLAGELTAKQGDLAGAIALFEEAVAAQDGLAYTMPPTWHYPVRQSLGALLLEAKRFPEAEAVYRADLERWPANGWSLHGLAIALREQIKMGEARETEAAFQRAFQDADVKLKASVFR